MMPKMNWFDALKIIKEQTSLLNTKIIIFSNLNNQNDIQKAYELWADEYLIKANTTPKEIFDKVNLVLWNNIIDWTCNCIWNCKDIIIECPCCREKIKIRVEKI